MLIIGLVTVALQIWAGAPGYDGGIPVTPALRTDTMSTDPRFHLPFTRDEYLAAQMQVRSREDALAYTARLFEPSGDVIGVNVMDGDLLLVALLSADLAARIGEYRPSLRERIDHFRQHRTTVLESWRTEIARNGSS